MKKAFLFTLAILTVMSMLIAMPATPAAAAGEKSITLLSVEFIHGKGMTLKFEIKGGFDSYDGFVILGGDSYPLSCQMNDNGVLVCSAPEGLKHFVGQGACGEVNGFPFCGQVRFRTLVHPQQDPQTPPPPPQSYCYTAYSWEAIVGVESESYWDDVFAMDNVCQDAPAVEGDAIIIQNGYVMDEGSPYYFANGNFYYYLDTPFNLPTNYGPAYYLISY